MKFKHLTCLTLLGFSIASQAQENPNFEPKTYSDIKSFVIKNDGKFSTETVEVKGIDYKKAISITASLDPDEIFLESYDADSSMMTITALNLFGFELERKCKTLGSFIGQNAFGVKFKVHKDKCEYLTLSPRGELITIKDVKIPMNPKQYREIKKQGLLLRVNFIVDRAHEGEITSIFHDISPATIKDRSEEDYTKYIFHANIKEVNLILPETKEEVNIYQKSK